MPLNTTTITLGDELKRLQEAYDAIGDAAEENDAAAEPAVATAETVIERKTNGVGYLVDEYGADATVTIGGLTMGDKALVRDKLDAVADEAAQSGVGTGGGAGSQEIHEAAAGIIDAPFVPDDIEDPTAPTAHDELVATLSSEYPQVTRWLVDRVRSQTSLPDQVGNG